MCWICQTWGRPRNHRKIAHRRKLREKGIGVRVQGSKASRRALRNAGCHRDCMCDFHEGVTDRMMGRALAKVDVMREIKDQLQ